MLNNNDYFEHIVKEALKKKNVEADEYKISAPDESDYSHIMESLNDINLSSFKIKKELCPKIWDKDGNMDSEVRMRLLDIADKFWESLPLTWVDIQDIWITGSICNYTWSELYSDIDLHIVVDFKDVDNHLDFVKDFFVSKKNLWKEKHCELKIHSFPVELYVQDVNEKNEFNAIYSLYTDEWLKKPTKKGLKNITLNKFFIKDKVYKIINIINDAGNDILSKNDRVEIEKANEDLIELMDNLKSKRKKSLAKDGEMSNWNIIYKTLRRMGYIKKIIELKNNAFDKINSITENLNKRK